jgi:hypothetical protein
MAMPRGRRISDWMLVAASFAAAAWIVLFS